MPNLPNNLRILKPPKIKLMGNRNSAPPQLKSKPTIPAPTPKFHRRAYWMYKTNEGEWTHYSDIENEFIEDAFASDRQEVLLNNDHTLDLKALLQISKTNPNETLQIKRETDLVLKEYIREERFHVPIIKVKAATISSDSLEMHPPMIIEWAKRNSVKADLFILQGDSSPFEHGLKYIQKIIKMAAEGIIQKGTELEKKQEAEWISNQLFQALAKFEQEKTWAIIEDCCIMLYTRESFLYKSINKMLREEDSSQLDQLAPFCHLLNGFIEARTYDFGTGYFQNTFRGVNLTPEMLLEYQNACEKKFVFTWPGFTSTSRSRERAEAFGNTLFVFTNTIMRVSDLEQLTYMTKRGLAIEKKSVFPEEQEVLYPANARFIIGKIEQNPATGKNIISLNRIKQ